MHMTSQMTCISPLFQKLHITYQPACKYAYQARNQIFFNLESADHEVSAFQNAEGKNSYINGPDSDA